MKEIKLFRIDVRLLHAQIILMWLKYLNINSVIVVDNEIAANPFLIKIYQLSIPPHIDLKIFSTQEMIHYYKEVTEVSFTKRRTLVITKEMETAVLLHKLGMEFEQLQLGSRFYDKSQRHHLNVDEIARKFAGELEYFDTEGVKVYWQSAPEDSKLIMRCEKT